MNEDRFAKTYLTHIIESDSSFTREDFEFVNILSGQEVTTLKELKKSKTDIIEELLKLSPECIISMGSDITKLLLGNAALSKVAGKLIPTEYGVPVVPCFDPKATQFDSSIKDQIPLTFSVIKLNFITDTSVSKPTITKITSKEILKDAINTLSQYDLIGFDIETAGDGKSGGLSPFNTGARILTAAFSSEKEAFWIDVNYTNKLDMNSDFIVLLNALKDKLVIHNRPFDVLFVKVMTGIFLDNTQDSMLVHYLIDENQKHGLKHLAFKLLGWTDYAESVKSVVKESHDFSEVTIDVLGLYNCLDACACLHIYNQGIKSLQNVNLYKFLLKIQNMYIGASINGFPVDLEYIASYKARILAEKEALLKEIYEYPEIKEAQKIVTYLENGWIDKEVFLSTGKVKKISKHPIDGSLVEYDILKPRHLLALLSVINKIPTIKTEKGGISLSASTLQEIEHPIIQKLSQVKSITTVANTFITGFLEKVRSDGKVHPNFALTRTVTGRTACSDPNLQQIPRDKEIKNFFYVPSGYKLVQFDFAQAEIRVIASLANDKNLIEAINKGTDMHKEVASFMYQKPVEEITKDERQAAKSLNFGVIYGMGPMALSKNLDISQEEAEDKLSRYMQQFYGVKRWIDDTHAFARKHLKVVTPFGRARNLPDIGLPDRGAVSGALRQAQNAPIQATASDLTLWLLHYIYSHIDKDNAVFLVSVHDSGVYAVKDEYMDSFINILKEGMYKLNTTFTFLKVPMKIDISIAEADETGKSRWGKVEEVSSI